jgi:hypothetical protein
MFIVSEKRQANRARKGTPVKDAYKRRKCQEFNAFGFSRRTARAGLSAGTA